MRFSAVKHLPLLVFFLAVLGCGNPQEEASRQLGQMNIKFTEDSFVDRARDGNIAAVKLFLQAGMKPDVTNCDGRDPIAGGGPVRTPRRGGDAPGPGRRPQPRG